MLVLEMDARLCSRIARRIVVHGRGHDVDALPGQVECRGREVGREGRHLAQVLRRRHDIERRVRGQRHEALGIDEGACPLHHVLILRERTLERGRVIGLDARQDLGLGRIRVDLPGGRGPGCPVGCELLIADGQDVVGAEAVEGTQRHELVEALATQGEVGTRLGQSLGDPVAVVGECQLGACGGRLEPGLGRLAWAEGLHAGMRR